MMMLRFFPARPAQSLDRATRYFIGPWSDVTL